MRRNFHSTIDGRRDPPGIPFVCPGEEISGETCAYIKALRDAGEKVIGVNDKGQVLVGRE